MNFETLKIGFRQYLIDLGQIQEKQDGTEDSSASFFLYSQEFKTYISEELDVDPQVLSLEVEDILKMDIVNGKLVDPNEIGSTEINEPDSSIENRNGIVSGLINEILQTDEYAKLLDSDNDNQLSNDEIVAFLNSIKNIDSNSNNISVDDILGAMEKLQKESFSLENSGDGGSDMSYSAMGSDMNVDDFNTSRYYGGKPAIGGTFTVPTRNGGIYVDKSFGYFSSAVKTYNIGHMSKSELNQELHTALGAVSSKQMELQSAQSGSIPELEELKGNENSLFDAYHQQLNLVNGQMATRLSAFRKAFDEQQKLISSKDAEISTQTTYISSCESSYKDAVKSYDSLYRALGGMKDTDTTNFSVSKKNEFNKQVELIEQKVALAERKKNNAKQEWDNAKAKLLTLKAERIDLETGPGGLNEIRVNMNSFETEIISQHSGLATYSSAYNTARETYYEAKNQAISTIAEKLMEAQAYVNLIQSAIATYDTSQEIKSYNLDPKDLYSAEAGRHLASNAASIPESESSGSLGGVSHSLTETYGLGLENLGSAAMAAEALRGNMQGYELLASHFAEVKIDRSQLSNLPPGAIVVWGSNKDSGSSNTTEGDNEHGYISISLGDGQESSDHIGEQTIDRNADYAVFYPII